LVALFLMQKNGTTVVGRLFGPATFLWFSTLIATGLPWIVRRPEILYAIDPRHAVLFFVHSGWHGFLILGAVVLCITGAEALYADMGHFGRRPIKLAWYAIVFPALLTSYFGQGALFLERGVAIENPFYELVSGWVRYPVVVIATVAATVASQALISGAYSLTRQAIQLGYWPRMTVVHTSGSTGFSIDDLLVTYYLGRETLLTTGRSKLAVWQKSLFALMARNAQPATAFFNIPPNRVVELGTQVEL
jgi:KUP system potassium uptake protein